MTAREDVRELAAAIIDALDVPKCASYRDRIEELVARGVRSANVLGALDHVVNGGSATAAAETIRNSTADTPITYATAEPGPRAGSAGPAPTDPPAALGCPAGDEGGLAGSRGLAAPAGPPDLDGGAR